MMDFCFKKHNFRRVARAIKGSTLEKYVECIKCGKVIIIINIHPDFWVNCDQLSKPIYFERKQLKRRIK